MLLQTYKRPPAAGSTRRQRPWLPTRCTDVRQPLPRADVEGDDELSTRALQLDPAGYFVIRLDSGIIVAEHYTNTIREDGIACDPDTGEPIPCTAGYVRPPSHEFRHTSAKGLSVAILEGPDGPVGCTRLEHANYLGRELQRAEMALLTGQEYVQD